MTVYHIFVPSTGVYPDKPGPRLSRGDSDASAWSGCRGSTCRLPSIGGRQVRDGAGAQIPETAQACPQHRQSKELQGKCRKSKVCGLCFRPP